MKFRVLIAIAAGLFTISGGAWASKSMEHSHGNEHIKKVMAEEGKQSDLTLLQVMQDLAFQLNRIQSGILTNNRYMIKQGALGIADHPAPKGGIKPYIKKNAEQIKTMVPAMDKQVHKTAVEMAEVADTASMLDLQKKADTIVTGCVSCHNLFRD